MTGSVVVENAEAGGSNAERGAGLDQKTQEEEIKSHEIKPGAVPPNQDPHPRKSPQLQDASALWNRLVIQQLGGGSAT